MQPLYMPIELIGEHQYEIIRLPKELYYMWYDGTQQGHYELLSKARQWVNDKYPTALLVAYERVTIHTAKKYKLPQDLYLKLRDLTPSELFLLKEGVLQQTPLWNHPEEEIWELSLTL
jgi:hypothetical protein